MTPAEFIQAVEALTLEAVRLRDAAAQGIPKNGLPSASYVHQLGQFVAACLILESIVCHGVADESQNGALPDL